MAKINSTDVAALQDFGFAADPLRPEAIYRMYVDMVAQEISIVDEDFDILFTFNAGGGSVGPGTVNRLAKFTPDGTHVGDSQLFDNGASVAIGTAAPNASALFQLESTTQGFLTPRMTTLQRNAIAAPATGLLIYNTGTNLFNYWDGAAWQEIDSNATSEWLLDGNTNGAVKYIGTNDNFDFPVYTNGTEMFRFLATGSAQLSSSVVGDIAFSINNMNGIGASGAVFQLLSNAAPQALYQMSVGKTDVGQANTTLLFRNTSTGNNFVFTKDGNFGIGAVAPVEFVEFTRDQDASTTLKISNFSAGLNAQSALYFNTSAGSGGVKMYGGNNSPYVGSGGDTVLFSDTANTRIVSQPVGSSIYFHPGGAATPPIKFSNTGNALFGQGLPDTFKVAVEGDIFSGTTVGGVAGVMRISGAGSAILNGSGADEVCFSYDVALNAPVISFNGGPYQQMVTAAYVTLQNAYVGSNGAGIGQNVDGITITKGNSGADNISMLDLIYTTAAGLSVTLTGATTPFGGWNIGDTVTSDNGATGTIIFVQLDVTGSGYIRLNPYAPNVFQWTISATVTNDITADTANVTGASTVGDKHAIKALTTNGAIAASFGGSTVSNNTVLDAFEMSHVVQGVPNGANGIGVANLYVAPNDTGINVIAARASGILEQAATGSELGSYLISVIDTGIVLPRVKFLAAGSQFFNSIDNSKIMSIDSPSAALSRIFTDSFAGNPNDLSFGIYSGGAQPWSLSAIFIAQSNAFVAIGHAVPAPTAMLHIQGSTANAAAYAQKIDDVAGTPLWYVRNDGALFTGALQGASGTFISADAKNITVTNGIITAIV